MAISKGRLANAHFALFDNGQIALVDTDRNGKQRVQRWVSREEVLNIIRTFYIQFRHDNPGTEVMQFPFGEESVMAIAVLPKPEADN